MTSDSDRASHRPRPPTAEQSSECLSKRPWLRRITEFSVLAAALVRLFKALKGGGL